MIRFIDLGNQISEDTKQFAFYDTVTNGFIMVNGMQAFESKEEFISQQSGFNDVAFFQRCLSLIPENWGND